MILEEETFAKYGHYPSELKPQSNKPILAACDDCGEIRTIRKQAYRSLCLSCAIKVFMKGKTNALGSKHSRNKGENNPNYGKRGADSSHYAGGKKVANARKDAKRRGLGHILLLPLVAGEVEHHVTDEYAIGILEEVHQQFGGHTRERHRALVLEWLKNNDTKKYEKVLSVLDNTS